MVCKGGHVNASVSALAVPWIVPYGLFLWGGLHP